MKLALSRRFRIAIEDGRAFVRRRSDDVAVAALSPPEAVALGLMDGGTPLEEIEARYAEICGAADVLRLHQLVARLQPLLSDGVPPLEPIGIGRLAHVRPHGEAHGMRELPGPRVLHWWVTSFCPRKCVYCFAAPQHGSDAPDAAISRARLREIFGEAAGLGAEQLLVAGAEPFLRDDLPEVMGDAIAVGLNILCTTKFPISQPLAVRLASAGLRHLSLSVDSFDASQNAALIGSRSYGEQVRRSAKHLREAGIAFSFQAVATALNPDAMDDVAEEAARSGARVLQIVPYKSVREPIGHLTDAELTLGSGADLDAQVLDLQARYSEVRIERFEELGEGDRTNLRCDIGKTKLFFLPNGVVHRCYKLTADRSLDGCDLREVSVAEAWHDPGFSWIVSPRRELYQASACGTCGNFTACHRDGRCIHQSFVSRGTYFAPDRPCGR